MLLGAVPAFAATNNTPTQHQAQMNNREQPPEPPKDANGNPLPPPDDQQQANKWFTAEPELALLFHAYNNGALN